MAAQSGVQQVLVDHLTIQPDAGPKLRSRPGNVAAGAESRRGPSSVGELLRLGCLDSMLVRI